MNQLNLASSHQDCSPWNKEREVGRSTRKDPRNKRSLELFGIPERKEK